MESSAPTHHSANAWPGCSCSAVLWCSLLIFSQVEAVLPVHTVLKSRLSSSPVLSCHCLDLASGLMTSTGLGCSHKLVWTALRIGVLGKGKRARRWLMKKEGSWYAWRPPAKHSLSLNRTERMDSWDKAGPRCRQFFSWSILEDSLESSLWSWAVESQKLSRFLKRAIGVCNWYFHLSYDELMLVIQPGRTITWGV